MPLIFFVKAILIVTVVPQIFQLCHIFKELISNLWAVILPCILMTIRKHRVSSSCVNFQTNLATSLWNNYRVFIYGIYVFLFLPNESGLTFIVYTRAVCKVRGFTLLLRVGNLWRCSDGLFFAIPPLASDAFLITLHPLLENGITVVLKEPFLGWRSNLSGASALRDWEVAMDALTEIGETPLEHPPCSPDLASCDFWDFPTMKRELRGQNRLLHYPPEACGKRSAARFREVGGAL
jgi:hypothetical protein